MTDRRTCPECGRSLDGLMAEHPDRDPFEIIINSRIVQAALCLLIVLAFVGLEAIIR